MKWLAAVVALLAAAVVLATSTAVSVLSALDVADIAIEPLIVGDLSQLLASNAFWNALPSVAAFESLVAAGPLLVVVGLGGVLLWGRGRRQPAPVLAAIALGLGVVPCAVGALALHGNTEPAASGPWLAWMLHGPLYAALLALLVLGAGAFGALAGPACRPSALVNPPAVAQ